MRDVLGSALRLGNSVLGVEGPSIMMQELQHQQQQRTIEVPVEAWEQLWELLRIANERTRLAEMEAAHARELL